MRKKNNVFACIIAIVALIALMTPFLTYAQVRGVRRTDLQCQDLSTPGREVVQARIDISQGVLAPRHSHPGEEVIYVLVGLLEYKLDGKPPVTLKAGDVLFIPAGVIHSAKNTGKGNAAELATYIVKKGKPLVLVAE
jgi:quercetin dioxygenase-like cupin family protein